MEGLAYDGTDQAIGHSRYVENNGLQFIVVDFAISQDRFISLLSYDFAYKDAKRSSKVLSSTGRGLPGRQRSSMAWAAMAGIVCT